MGDYKLPIPSFARSTFVTHSVPDFHPNDSFVLACTVPGQSPHNFRNALQVHLAEFGAFKFLIERTATRTEPQFVTSVEPAALPYLNYGDKNVLSGWEPHGNRKAQYVDYARTEGPKGNKKRVFPGPIISSFARKIKDEAEAIREGGDPNIKLVIVVCGPTSIQQDVLGNLQMPIPSTSDFVPIFWMVEDIREAVGPGVHSVLITPNMLGAGWVVSPNFTTLDGWESSLGSRAEERRAACNISPLIAKGVRATLIREAFMSGRTDFDMVDVPSENVRDCLGNLREAFHGASLSFFFESAPSTSLNFNPESDNWGRFVEGGRRVSIEQHKNLWDQLPQAVADDQSLPNNPSLVKITHSLGRLDRTLLPNHCKILALVQRFDWTSERSPEKTSHLFYLNTCLYLPEEMAVHERPRLRAVSLYRLACHNLADLMMEMNTRNPSCGFPEEIRSLRFGCRCIDSGGTMVPELSHPISLNKRMDFIRDVLFDPTQSEFLDDPLGRGDAITASRSNFIRSLERSDRPCQCLAEVLNFPPTAQSAEEFDGELLLLSPTMKSQHANTRPSVRHFFTKSCREAACRDPSIRQTLKDLKLAILEESSESVRQAWREFEVDIMRHLMRLYLDQESSESTCT